ncbi:hypothetical protein PE36_17765 [Moritella sp. PE36]|uniref:retron Ec48 family effector membrane protein n=1 Tax=Moritella sp. PE36 TaxID=58051 RepID=UPI00015682CA|nr:retron Ec48 family effector membrane protein [Moritella sp. PE36]EDM67836.1 hypothetical protein PE36_17765 [Moritella sp. PE36]
MKSNYSEVKALLNSLKIYLIVSAILTILIAIFSLGKAGLFSQNICFTYQCIDSFFSELTNVISFVDFALKVLVSSVTIFGIYHALNNYLSSIDASRSNIHLTHLNTFKDYLISEVSSHDRLNIKSFNFFKWYNIAFPLSRNGKLDIGVDYENWINELNAEIKISNDLVQGVTASGYDYKKHQGRMIKVMKKVGINCPRLHRNDFYELEGEVMQLINKVNMEFCFLDKKIFKRHYN